MKAAEALIAWTPDSRDAVEVGPLLRAGEADWTEPYDYTGGAAYTTRRKMTGPLATAMVFIEFHTLVVRDGLDPQAVHREFLKIDEFRDHMSPDCPGLGDPP
jgi:hypothetical protein